MHGQRTKALAVSTAMCFPCGLSDPAWRSFIMRVLWSHGCRGTAKAEVLGFANGSVSGVRDGHSLISAFT